MFVLKILNINFIILFYYNNNNFNYGLFLY